MVTIQIDITADPIPSLNWSKDGKDLFNLAKFISRIKHQSGNKYTIYFDIKVDYSLTSSKLNTKQKKSFFCFYDRI